MDSIEEIRLIANKSIWQLCKKHGIVMSYIANTGKRVKIPAQVLLKELHTR
jgi:hypothetical protein